MKKVHFKVSAKALGIRLGVLDLENQIEEEDLQLAYLLPWKEWPMDL